MKRWVAVSIVAGLFLMACSGPGAGTPPRSRASAASVISSAPQPAGLPSPVVSSSPMFEGSVSTVGAERLPYSWRPGCPVPVESLRLLTVSFWDFAGERRSGELVIHKDHAEQVLWAMKRLYDLRFPIERMELVDNYQGDDDLSVAANNTSAFNCRSVTGRQGVWSQHSYGWAIDINPVQNPYISSGIVSPPSAAKYADRSLKLPGMIHAGDEVVEAFASIGWSWGGTWTNPKDYQHFSATGK